MQSSDRAILCAKARDELATMSAAGAVDRNYQTYFPPARMVQALND